MDSIGDTLHRERLRRGWKLEQVAAETKIGQDLLQAMEEDQFDRLPGGLFTRSFVRQYTHILGLDEDQIMTSLQQQVGEPQVQLPKPPPKPRHFPYLLVCAWLVAALFACGLVYRLSEGARRNLPESKGLRSAVRVPGASPNANATQSIPALPAMAEPRSVGASLGNTTTDKSTEPRTGAMHVVFTATESVWVSIKSDGVLTYSGMLEGQQSKEFDANSKMTVLVGNAGGLAISVNGKPVTPTGAHGEVRLLALTPNGVQVVPRSAPAPAPPPEDDSAPPDQVAIPR